MINLLKSEIFRLFNRRYTYVFLGALVAIVFLMNLINSLFIGMSANDLFGMTLEILIIPIFLWPLLSDIITGEEFKENTYKNVAVFGISKTKFFLSKVIMSVVMVVITVFIIVFTLSVSVLLFKPHELPDSAFYSNYIMAVLSAIPLYIAAIIICTLITFFIKRKHSLTTFCYFVLFLVTNPCLSILRSAGIAFAGKIYNCLITTQIFNLMGKMHPVTIQSSHTHLDMSVGGNVPHEQMLTAAGVGLAYILIFTVIGLISSSKKWE